MLMSLRSCLRSEPAWTSTSSDNGSTPRTDLFRAVAPTKRVYALPLERGPKSSADGVGGLQQLALRQPATGHQVLCLSGTAISLARRRHQRVATALDYSILRCIVIRVVAERRFA